MLKVWDQLGTRGREGEGMGDEDKGQEAKQNMLTKVLRKLIQNHSLKPAWTAELAPGQSKQTKVKRKEEKRERKEKKRKERSVGWGHSSMVEH